MDELLPELAKQVAVLDRAAHFLMENIRRHFGTQEGVASAEQAAMNRKLETLYRAAEWARSDVAEAALLAGIKKQGGRDEDCSQEEPAVVA